MGNRKVSAWYTEPCACEIESGNTWQGQLSYAYMLLKDCGWTEIVSLVIGDKTQKIDKAAASKIQNKLSELAKRKCLLFAEYVNVLYLRFEYQQIQYNAAIKKYIAGVRVYEPDWDNYWVKVFHDVLDQ